MKKIVICSSIKFGKEIMEWKDILEDIGFRVIKYPVRTKDGVSYEEEFSSHYFSISKADAILVLNLEKDGIPGYIGPGVFAEIAFAIGWEKVKGKDIKVYYVNPIPDSLPYSEELRLWQSLGWLIPVDKASANPEKQDDIYSTGSIKDDYYYDAMDYLFEGDADEAIRLLKKALKMDEHYLAGYVGMASSYLKKKDMKEYKKYVERGFEEVKAVYPEWPTECRWGVMSNRPALRLICYKAMLEHSLGNLAEAESLYRLLLKINPHDNQGVRYLISAMFAGFGPEYADELTEEGNRKQDWSRLEKLFLEQNKKHDFWCLRDEDEEL
ncbi:MAG: hypothetical protein MNSN_06860 [Minisyncoccus archaeiphilus]|uniref:hypothetical protein n=1 Tax=Minisyncoccus archaeiphilus TaxID=3238481 RepID=UPI0009CC5DD1|nr:MAG: hypothetical protein BWY21_01424 [Parcubacteria group bacterium ADurb.Bin216]GMX59681.1 MAG: hypothetical protein MNSN_06860 [Candidatus Parcubacteria bacterium]